MIYIPADPYHETVITAVTKEILSNKYIAQRDETYPPTMCDTCFFVSQMRGNRQLHSSQEAKLEIIAAEGHGDTAIEISTFTLLGEGGQVLDKGKCMII